MTSAMYFLIPEYRKALQQMWFQQDPSCKHRVPPLIISPLQSMNKKKSRVGVLTLATLTDLILKRHSQLRYFTQNDAQEFLRLLVGDLHSETLRPHTQGVVPEASATNSDLR